MLGLYLRVITEESVLKEIFQVTDIVDLTPILWENILHANFCFLRKQITDVVVTWLEFDWTNVYLVSGKKYENCWRSVTTVTEPVRNNFIKERVIVKSNDFLSRTNRGHASTPYNSTGKHFVLIPIFWRSFLTQFMKGSIVSKISWNLIYQPLWHIHPRIQQNPHFQTCLKIIAIIITDMTSL